MGQPYSPSGFGHAIILDANNHKVRPLSLLGRWLITGGGDSLFNTLPDGYSERDILSSTTPAVQLFLLQLTLGIIGASSLEDGGYGRIRKLCLILFQAFRLLVVTRVFFLNG